jgi:hypothetical protein
VRFDSPFGKEPERLARAGILFDSEYLNFQDFFDRVTG